MVSLFSLVRLAGKRRTDVGEFLSDRVPERAVGSHPVWSFLHPSIVPLAPSRLINQCSFRHSSRKCPLKLPTKGFRIGSPGSMK